MNTPDVAAIQRATRALYDRQAAEYARSTDDYGRFPGLLAELDRFLNRADRSRPLLDLGCGTGRDVAYLRKQGCTAVAADLSIQMLRTAEQWCA
ncbi:MAG: class I SAM-dependent methyltransferase, partial [Pseudonocardiaceae bacterium]